VTASFKRLEVDKDSPILSAEIPVRLEDGIPDFERGTYRTEVILPPMVPERTVAMTIRKQSLVKMTLPAYQEQAAFRFLETAADDEPYCDARLLELYRARQWPEFLRAGIRAHKNIVISAGTYCGKTTCRNALVQEIPAHERIVTIEDSREIEPAQPNCVRLAYARHQASGQTMWCKAKKPHRTAYRNGGKVNPTSVLSELRCSKSEVFASCKHSFYQWQSLSWIDQWNPQPESGICSSESSYSTNPQRMPSFVCFPLKAETIISTSVINPKTTAAAFRNPATNNPNEMMALAIHR